jgi:tRNA dimethylallyltransferase
MSSNDASAANSLRVIVGPTAAGKSALAVRLAERYGASIINADSRQIYRGFDVGTGKPSADERSRAPHFGLDVAGATERWSAMRFAESAAEWIREIQDTGRTPLVAGGTGFWISALIAPLAPVPDLDPERRDALDAELALRSREELRAWCASLDPEIARRGPAQWRRAIQVALLTGRRLTDWHRADPTTPPRSVRYLLVDPGPALDARIAARVDAMLTAGWMDEVRALAAAVPHTAIAWKACGYERLRAAVESGFTDTEAPTDVIRETRQYARRQRTWFRRQLKHGPVTRLDPLLAGAWQRACAWWEGEDDA